MTQASTLRPGLLVSLKTGIKGNIAYRKATTEREHTTKDGVQVAKWETERKIADPEEFEAAKQIRAKAWSLIAATCATTAFGLLCPEVDADQLATAIEEAQNLAREFNNKSRITKVSIFAVTGRIAQDDVQAVRAINSEVRDLLDDMKEGIEALDVKAVRAAAQKAKSIGQMLTPETQARITTAIEAARKSAREIVKAGENAAQAIDKRSLRVLAESRTAFLDLDGDEEAVATPTTKARAVDLEPAAPVASPKSRARQTEEV